MASSKQTQAVSTNANTTKRMSTPGSSVSAAASGSTAGAASTTPGVNPDKAIARLLYAMLKQKSLKDIDWNQVASDPVLLEGISNGHAARMRYSRFRNAVENSKSAKRQPKSSASAASDAKASCNRVTKRKSVGARKVADEDGDDRRDADGDTEEDDDEHYTGKGKENRYQQCKAFETFKAERSVAAKIPKHPELDTPRGARMPKEDPDVMDPQVSFSSLPSPPMESENTMDFTDESPLIGQEPLFPSAAPAASTRDRLLILKKRKAAMHSPTMDMETTLHQIPQVPQAQAQAHSHMRYGLPDMGAGLGLSLGASRIHSMPLLHSPHHKQDFSSMPGYSGGVEMMRHHSAGSLSGLAGAGISQPHQAHQAHQPHHIVSSNGPLLSHPRTRLLTPSSDDHQQQQQHHQQQLNFLNQKHMPSLAVNDFLAFGAPFSVSSMNQANANQNPSINEGATPHTQWTSTPFASPPLGDTLDSTLSNTLDMSPYMASGMDFGATGDGSMDPIMNSIDPSTSLFAIADDTQQQPQNSEQYMAHAFAKHSNGWDAMISQGPHV
ncbi:hypothetical protein F503_08108 [Ophiostoma piceae UAMH 11346]|uniref:Myb-like DNA-binding domain-containing protein n=1 Tax=Ophiostoma piceae (strain UAMH 11346) TaxID=1262450 RepID=S3C3T9_OPHP1|nr:hypothetical protein F503_08108 [Ophiostoma piceae UAMH 11346]